MSSATVVVWRHSETEKAILVSSSPTSPRSHEGTWLARSQVKIIGSENVENPLFGTEPHIAKFLGTRLTIEMPDWLARGLI